MVELRSQTVKCQFCSNFECHYDNLKSLRNHHSYHHSDISWPNHAYTLKREDDCPVGVLRNTHLKRKRVAEKKSTSNFKPRQCGHYIHGNKSKQCKIKIISGVKLNSRVRCNVHQWKDVQFAAIYGVYNLTGRTNGYITLRESQISGGGRGVWTTHTSYCQSEYLTEYGGVFTTAEQVEKGDYNRQHTIECAGFTEPYLSGLTTPVVGLGLGSFINRGSRDSSALQVNCEYVWRKESQTVWVRCITYIPPYSELFISYGSGFHIPRPLSDET